MYLCSLLYVAYHNRVNCQLFCYAFRSAVEWRWPIAPKGKSLLSCDGMRLRTVEVLERRSSYLIIEKGDSVLECRGLLPILIVPAGGAVPYR
jgi:hypothetical protein